MAAYRLDDVFRALADPSRRQLLDNLNARNGQTLHELCAGLDMARQSVSKHLAILEAANLVTTLRQGREKLHYLNAAPITEISERWINHYDRRRVDALSDLKRALEDTTMEKPEFVHTSYIRTTPEQLWRAITDPTFTRQYLGVSFDTDWSAGATMDWVLERTGATISDPEQVVLESDPYRRLAYTWHTFTPEWAEAFDIPADTRAAFASEPRSKVTFELEPDGELVKLTVIHGGFEPGSAVLDGIGDGWPRLLSELKTLVETGAPVAV
jgi:uncharacterized protein YndB with AHSA1/START domain/DNA-binding transcriptional ArsR family regulator